MGKYSMDNTIKAVATMVVLGAACFTPGSTATREHSYLRLQNHSDQAYLRPIIGILSLPNYFDKFQDKGRSYFPSSYVKWVESGGARVVPIPYTMDHDELRQLIPQLNGFLFTGGGTDFAFENNTLTPYARAAQIILEEVESANRNNGEVVPLWGTCLGFELLSFLLSGPDFKNPVLHGGFDSENITLPLHFTDAAPNSRMYGLAKKRGLYDVFANQPITMNNHHAGVPPSAFDTNSNLKSTVNLLSTNYDRQNNEFGSSFEGKELPIYAVQYHPEKPVYEWDPQEVINHEYDSVRANSLLARFFVNQSRKNDRHFAQQSTESKHLIYNYETVYTGPVIDSFETCYFFD
eukprot:gb/GECG01003482.1/.p1 GENE.gb/GECG01003482.1/~~gb/GECG01003482.1/.p1  ORF type:complete len:349 (+),score=29.44 gb/GECG01003482.1/:1-1047(+)